MFEPKLTACQVSKLPTRPPGNLGTGAKYDTSPVATRGLRSLVSLVMTMHLQVRYILAELFL